MTQKAKGPATAATVPDHGSNPERGIMNMQSNITFPKHAAIEADWNLNGANLYYSGNSFLSHSVDELSAVFDALVTIEGVISGLINRPNLNNERTKNLNNGGRSLQRLMEFVDEIACLVANTAKSVIPSTPEEYERRAWLLLHHEVQFRENLDDFNALALKLAIGNAEISGAAE